MTTLTPSSDRTTPCTVFRHTAAPSRRGTVRWLVLGLAVLVAIVAAV